MASIGIALIGGGIFIKEAHLPAVLATPGLAIKAVYSRSAKSAQETAALVPASHAASVDLYSDDTAADGTKGGYDNLLSRPDVNAVIIALPIANQPAYIRKALQAGKHVLAEKPAAPDLESGKALVDWYRNEVRTGATWSVAEQYRCMPNYLLGAAEARKLGKVTGFRVVQSFMMKEDNPYYSTSWRKVPTHNYAFILDAGVHHVAAMRMLLGSDDVAETVAGLHHTATTHLPPPDSLNGIVRTASGVTGSFITSCGSTLPPVSQYAVSCERGSVTVERDTVTIVSADGAKRVIEVDASQGVKLEVQAWAAALAAGTPDPRLAPEEGLADLELLLGLLKSGDAGGVPQTLSLQKVGGT